MAFEIDKHDAVEWLQLWDDESFDLVITDPAYESLEKHRAIGTTTRLKDWFDTFPNSRYPDLFRELYRTLKRNTHLYVICDEETRDVVKPIGVEAGFTFWKSLVWDKVSIGTGYHYRASYEFILFFEKGKRNLNSKSVRDVLEAKRVSGRGSYPTEKPVALLEKLILNSSEPGDHVADPFMGSASTGVAALRRGRNFYGCDTSGRSISRAAGNLRLAEGDEEVEALCAKCFEPQFEDDDGRITCPLKHHGHESV